MANSVDWLDKLNQLNLDLLRAEKRQKLEQQKIERLVKKSELQIAKYREQLKDNELRIHAWILQKSRIRSEACLVKTSDQNEYSLTRLSQTNQKATLASRFVGNPVTRIEQWIDLPSHPSLHNLFLRRHQIEQAIKNATSEVQSTKELEYKSKKSFEYEMVAIKEKIRSINWKNQNQNSSQKKLEMKTKVPKMAIENWEDAEVFAVKYMRWLGFADAQKTGSGSDEGKDVDSSKAVAQVKDMGTGVSRPMLQQLFGVAAAEKKIPVFFARTYAKTAKEWGQKHGMALFQFSIRGDVKAVSTKAEQILKKKLS
jgi:hypothetical protein